MIGRITGRKPAAQNAGAKLDSDLGLSSLDRVELISALEDRYQVDLSETSFSAARTVGDVEKMLRGEVKQRVEYPLSGLGIAMAGNVDAMARAIFADDAGGYVAGLAAH